MIDGSLPGLAAATAEHAGRGGHEERDNHLLPAHISDALRGESEPSQHSDMCARDVKKIGALSFFSDWCKNKVADVSLEEVDWQPVFMMTHERRGSQQALQPRDWARKQGWPSTNTQAY